MRIYPIYWIITLTVLYVFLVIPGWANNKDLGLGKVIVSLLLIPQNDKPILDVGWTLIYELYFYFLFSIAIWLKPKILYRYFQRGYLSRFYIFVKL